MTAHTIIKNDTTFGLDLMTFSAFSLVKAHAKKMAKELNIEITEDDSVNEILSAVTHATPFVTYTYYPTLIDAELIEAQVSVTDEA